jgi:uncharacterized 2Fe-2S/4Fe-4S cluster protein (DUF4445 family)
MVLRDGISLSVAVEDAVVLLELLADHGIPVDAPCGGAGTCGKCVVQVTGAGAPDAVERALLPPERLAAGERLACRLLAVPGLMVTVATARGGADHKAELGAPAPAAAGAAAFSPVADAPLRRRRVELPPPSLDDSAADLERLLRHAGCGAHRLSLAALRALPALLRASEYRVDVFEAVEGADEPSATLLAVAPAGAPGAVESPGPWGVAVDLGTTTVAAYLLDLGTGHAVDVHAELNRQADLGADVLSRIAHAREAGVAGLQRRAVTQLEAMMQLLAERNGLEAADILGLTVAGNTTMLHVLLGLDPAGIGAAPFVPVTTGARAFWASEVGLPLHPAALVRTLPAASAYIGADTVAAVLAAGIDEGDGLSLLVDLGTNGEIVLGSASGLSACSTAAGPAFEGARIRCGVGGVQGAVAAFAISAEGVPVATTIGGAPAVGLCGAGLLDLVAALLEAGIVDGGGRLLPEGELPDGVPDAMRGRCREVDGRPAFVVVPAAEARDGAPIVLTERDVRELQFAKAAVAAGIDALLAAAGVRLESVERVILTGGFGAFLDPRSAVRVGLLPAVLGPRTEALANAAGVGAVMAATSRAHARRCDAIAARLRVVELSASAAFAQAYVEHLGFAPLRGLAAP